MNKILIFLKKEEALLSLIIISLILLFIPLKIIQYGWLPGDDAKRHAAFSTIDKNWSDIVVIKDNYASDHNPGWHAILKFFHKKLLVNKDNLLKLSVIGLFLLINFCGIIASPAPIAWVLAFLFTLLCDGGVLSRFLLGRPYIVFGAFMFLLFKLWNNYEASNKYDDEKQSYLRFIYTVILITLCTWIHGSWYLFLLLPFAFLLAGKIKDSLYLILAIFIGTIIGALLTGDFEGFIRFHVLATFNIFSEKTYNWLLVSELYSGMQNNYCLVFIAVLIAFGMYKKQITIKDLFKDPAFLYMLLCWLLSILVLRFWVDCGRIALLYWASYRIYEIIKNSENLKEARVRYCLFIFIILTFTFMTTNDCYGRYSKAVFNQPIDFSEERLAGWAPEPGGIIYSDSMGVFYEHFFAYPDAPWKYILGFEPALMPDEDRKILRKIGYNFRMPDEFIPWVKKMTKADRLITTGYIGGDIPELEAERGARFYCIYRLKTATDTADIASSTASIGSYTADICSATANIASAIDKISSTTLSIATETSNIASDSMLKK